VPLGPDGGFPRGNQVSWREASTPSPGTSWNIISLQNHLVSVSLTPSFFARQGCYLVHHHHRPLPLSCHARTMRRVVPPGVQTLLPAQGSRVATLDAILRHLRCALRAASQTILRHGRPDRTSADLGLRGQVRFSTTGTGPDVLTSAMGENFPASADPVSSDGEGAIRPSRRPVRRPRIHHCGPLLRYCADQRPTDVSRAPPSHVPIP